MSKTKQTTPERHQLKIARSTLQLSRAGAFILGGPSHEQARQIIQHLTGKRPPMLPEHGDYQKETR